MRGSSMGLGLKQPARAGSHGHKSGGHNPSLPVKPKLGSPPCGHRNVSFDLFLVPHPDGVKFGCRTGPLHHSRIFDPWFLNICTPFWHAPAVLLVTADPPNRLCCLRYYDSFADVPAIEATATSPCIHCFRNYRYIDSYSYCLVWRFR